jgi:hypothetical protein
MYARLGTATNNLDRVILGATEDDAVQVNILSKGELSDCVSLRIAIKNSDQLMPTTTIEEASLLRHLSKSNASK